MNERAEVPMEILRALGERVLARVSEYSHGRVHGQPSEVRVLELSDRVAGFDLRARVGELTTITLVMPNVSAKVEAIARELNDATLRQRLRRLAENWRDGDDDRYPLDVGVQKLLEEVEAELVR